MATETPAFQTTLLPPHAPQAPASERTPELTPKRRRYGLIAAGLAIAFLLGFGAYRWQDASTHVETDDAAVSGHLHNVSTRVTGTVAQVAIEDNQAVKAGQVLFTLDDRDAKIRLAEAQAALEAARRQAEAATLGQGVSARSADGQNSQALGSLSAARAGIQSAQAAVQLARAGVPTAEAQLAQAQANAAQAEADLGRYRSLYAEGGLSAQQMQATETVARNARAQTRQAREAVAEANARLAAAEQDVARARGQAESAAGGLTLASASSLQADVSRKQAAVSLASVDQAEAALADARQQLAYTRVVAPCDGRIAKRNVEVGERVQPGQSLLALIEPTTWVEANFKETQLRDMRAGEPVEIRLDAFPQRVFTGHVESFSPSAGSQLALLPPDNATGNFTKVVQRVPVKITFDAASLQGFNDRIVPGMSAIVKVQVK